jgi:DsbC/DsbD-like thiol-disulfide interchange protein
MRISASLLSLCLFAVPAGAAETAWQELAPEVMVRLIGVGEVAADGTSWVAVELDMPADVKTYWRVPGETGLAADLQFFGVDTHAVHWPYPIREEKDGYTDYIYRGHTILPIELSGAAGGEVELSMTLGVCSEICVPARAELSLVLDGGADDPNALRIRQALAATPIEWSEAEEPIGAATLAADGDALVVSLDPAVLDPESIIAASVDGFTAFGAPQKSPQANLVELPMLGKTDNSALVGTEIELSFLTATGAYRVTRIVETGK